MSYSIVESTSRGKIVVAAKDILPGELILEEEPIIFVPPNDPLKLAKEYPETTGFLELITSFHIFMRQLNAEQKAKVMSLFGPTTGTTASNIRNIVLPTFKYRPQARAPARLLTEEEKEMFLKVVVVMKFNMFGVADGQALYSETTRIAHSCASNCHYLFKGTTILCLATRHIKAGEEMTISYVVDRDTEPTHERRYKYLLYKEFTCHCPRCDAPGDDTRQFYCCWCKEGVIMVCQPINKNEFVMPGLSYDDVEYVESHLLPCTVCHRPPPPVYQKLMFEIEKTALPAVRNVFAATCARLHTHPVPDFNTFFEKAEQLPLKHQLSIPILLSLMEMRFFLYRQAVLRRDGVLVATARADLQRVAQRYISAQEGIFPWPHPTTRKALVCAVTECITLPANLGLPPVLPPLEAKQLLQRAVRMGLVLSGRDDRDELLDSALVKVMDGIVVPHEVRDMQVCAFCEESPASAFMKRSRCGACKKVMYCSAGCQKAHWKLHKKTCGCNK